MPSPSLMAMEEEARYQGPTDEAIEASKPYVPIRGWQCPVCGAGVSPRVTVCSPPQTPPYETGLIYTLSPATKMPPQFRNIGRWHGDPEQAHRKDSFWQGATIWSSAIMRGETQPEEHPGLVALQWLAFVSVVLIAGASIGHFGRVWGLW